MKKQEQRNFEQVLIKETAKMERQGERGRAQRAAKTHREAAKRTSMPTAAIISRRSII